MQCRCHGHQPSLIVQKPAPIKTLLENLSGRFDLLTSRAINCNSMKLRCFFLLWPLCFSAYSQLNGTITLPHAGVEFTIPAGWIGQKTEAGYMLGSQTEAGAIFLSNHQSTSLEALKAEALKGIHEEGLQLMVHGAPETLDGNVLAASYTGLLQGQAVKAFAVGLINPFGRGVLILALTTPEMFTERHQQLAKQIAESIRFFQAERSPVVDEWKQGLTNARLTYMESYSSQDGGYSDKIVIELCGAGHFRHSKRYRMGIDSGGAFANDNSTSQGSGTWEVTQDASGNPVLELKYNGGEVQEYTLQYVNEKTLLNGTRYFRTYDAGCP
jgi:hypothetical protein